MKNYGPFVSITIIIVTLFLVAFMKMEVRRQGYVVLKEGRILKSLKDQQRLKAMEMARVTRPERIRSYAVSRLTMGEAQSGQIIQLVGERIAVSQ